VLFRGRLDVLHVDEDFARTDQTELFPSDGFDRRPILAQAASGFAKRVIFAAKTLDRRAEVVVLLPRARARDESSFANECIREQHDRREDEKYVQRAPPCRSRARGLHTFAPQGLGTIWAAGTKTRGIWGNRRHRLGLSFVQWFFVPSTPGM
jgi:hypothetical protein